MLTAIQGKREVAASRGGGGGGTGWAWDRAYARRSAAAAPPPGTTERHNGSVVGVVSRLKGADGLDLVSRERKVKYVKIL